MQKKHLAIIGAGFSGLLIARKLAPHFEVTVFEKARGVGGRMSTRYADPFYFDHGAQCFTARTDEFQEQVDEWIAHGHVAEWQGNVLNFELGIPSSNRIWKETHLVCTPNMNSLCKAIETNVNVRLNCEIAPLVKQSEGSWALYNTKEECVGAYDYVISTAPPQQTIRLFGDLIPQDSAIRDAKLYGCYAVMLGYHQKWDQDWIAARVRNAPLKWISVNSTKPGRNSDVTCFVAHSRNNWAEQHIDDAMQSAEAILLDVFHQATGIDPKSADYVTTHRWRYAIVEQAPKPGPYFDANLGIAATSDWTQTSRIEEVWHNAMNLAERMKAL